MVLGGRVRWIGCLAETTGSVASGRMLLVIFARARKMKRRNISGHSLRAHSGILPVCRYSATQS